MRKIAWLFAIVVVVLCSRRMPKGSIRPSASAIESTSASHATVTQAGLQFQGARFFPMMGTPFGHMEFMIATTNSCNIRMFGTNAFGLVPIFDSGPIMSGVYPAWVNGVTRGAWQEFVIASFDCFGNMRAQDRISFFTPLPQIVTVEQWEQVTVSRRTVRIGYQ